jgi:ketol-acid reductoisomerase
MSRATRFLGMGLITRMQKIYHDIETGAFAREWNNPISRLKFKAIRFLALRQSINTLEQQVRESLQLRDQPHFEQSPELDQILEDPTLRTALDEFEDAFEF